MTLLKLLEEGGRAAFVYRPPASVFLAAGGTLVVMDPSDRLTPEEARLISGRPVLALYSSDSRASYDREVAILLGLEGALVVCNKPVFRDLRRRIPDEKLVKIKSGETLELGAVRVRAQRAVQPGLHPLVFLVEVGPLSVFYGSASGFSRAFSRFSPVDLAFVPLSGSPAASVGEALRIARSLQPAVVVPIGGSRESLERFSTSAQSALPGSTVILPEPDEVYSVDFEK